MKAKELSLKEKIGQMVMIGMDTNYITDRIKNMIINYKIGGVILYRKNFSTYSEMLKLIRELKELNKNNQIPLFIAIDQEGGRVNRMPKELKNLPSANVIANVGGEKLVKEASEITGELLYKSGFNLNFAPVLDLRRYEKQKVIGDRSFGYDKEKVSECGIAVMKALQKNNIVSVVKHFPGHGDTEEDSHYGEAKSWKTLDELRTCELRPFQAGIEAGASMIMVGHITLPNVTEEIPATLSHDIVTGILREEMKYNGIIITDSMAMNAIANWYSSDEAAVKAIQAGCDMILMPYQLESAVNGIETAVNSGDITEERIEESVLRILKAKLEAGIIE